jgi:hypothetical protein
MGFSLDRRDLLLGSVGRQRTHCDEIARCGIPSSHGSGRISAGQFHEAKPGSSHLRDGWQWSSLGQYLLEGLSLPRRPLVRQNKSGKLHERVSCGVGWRPARSWQGLPLKQITSAYIPPGASA